MRKSLLTLILLTWALPVFAHEAHVHGLAKITLALEGTGGELSLFSAQGNFLPFEHAPQTPEERQASQALLEQLKQPQGLLTFNAEAQCQLKVQALKAQGLAEHGQHADHDHANIRLDIVFTCQKPQDLHSLALPLWRKYPALKEIELEMVTDSGQSSAHLHPDTEVFSWQRP